VQVIKKDEKEGGILEFGTEVITTQDGSLSVLLGASPGASTAVSIMIDLIERCFKDQFKTAEWQQKLKVMIPSHGHKLNENPDLLAEIRKETATVLKLNT
jgi:malate dehydrogenase (quinone)